jgi:hypothetical protein
MGWGWNGMEFRDAYSGSEGLGCGARTPFCLENKTVEDLSEPGPEIETLYLQ